MGDREAAPEGSRGPQEGHSEGHKVFVGSLPSDCSTEELQIVFSTYGEVNSIRMMPPHARTGNRCAFIFYSTYEAAEDAIEVLDGKYKIRQDAEAPIDVRWPKDSRDKSGEKGGKGDGKGREDWSHSSGGGRNSSWSQGRERSGGNHDSATHRDQGAGHHEPGKNRLFVGSLPADVSEDDLKTVFRTYGEVKDVHIMAPNQTGKKAAFVCYSDIEAAEDAIKVLDRQYKIRENAEDPIVVRWADDSRSKAKAGGDYGKGGGKGGKGWQSQDGWHDQRDSWNSRPNHAHQNGGWQGGGRGGWDRDDWQERGGGSWGGGGGRGGGSSGGRYGRDQGAGGWGGGSGRGNGGGADSWHDNEQEEQSGTRLYVANLPEDIKEDALQYVFGKYGSVEKIHIMSEKSRKGAIAAFVHYSKPEQAETAIVTLHNSYEIRPGFGPLIVNHARPSGGRYRPY